MIELRRILLAADVEIDFLGKVGGVAHVPARLIALHRIGAIAQEHLDFLAIGIDPPGGAADRQPGGHLAKRFIAPVHRQRSGLAIGEEQRRIDLVVGVGRKDLAQHAAAHLDGHAEQPVDQVQRVRGIVVKAAAALASLGAPGRALGLEHHRAIGLCADMVDRADRAGRDQPAHFHERSDKAVVIADLVDQPFGLGQRGQLVRFGAAQRERLFAEHVDPAFERCLHHRIVRARRRGDDHRIGPRILEHFRIVGICRDAGVFLEHVKHIAGGIADCRQIDPRVGLDHAQVGNPHLAQAHNRYLDHNQPFRSMSCPGDMPDVGGGPPVLPAAAQGSRRFITGLSRGKHLCRNGFVRCSIVRFEQLCKAGQRFRCGADRGRARCRIAAGQSPGSRRKYWP